MATFFVVSDVHSYYDLMIEALKRKGFDINNPNHVFVSLGDLLDRGPDPVKCLEFVNGLPINRKILIRGNHEDLLEEAIIRKSFQWHDVHNGTVATVEALTGVKCDQNNSQPTSHAMLDIMRTNSLWNTYIRSTLDYFETEKYIFVHGWIPCGYGEVYWDDWRIDCAHYGWEEARWYNGMHCWKNGVREEGKTIFCGHFHTSWGHSHIHLKGPEWNDPLFPDDPKAHFEPFKDEGICAIDGCTAYSGVVNCIKLGKQRKLEVEKIYGI